MIETGTDSAGYAKGESDPNTNTFSPAVFPTQLRLIPTILCGGAGSRLWPVSRELHPKPFIRMGDGQSLGSYSMFEAASVGTPSLTNVGRHTMELCCAANPNLHAAFIDFSDINLTRNRILEILLNQKIGSDLVHLINGAKQDWSQSWSELQAVFDSVLHSSSAN